MLVSQVPSNSITYALVNKVQSGFRMATLCNSLLYEAEDCCILLESGTTVRDEKKP